MSSLPASILLLTYSLCLKKALEHYCHSYSTSPVWSITLKNIQFFIRKEIFQINPSFIHPKGQLRKTLCIPATFIVHPHGSNKQKNVIITFFSQ